MTWLLMIEYLMIFYYDHSIDFIYHKEKEKLKEKSRNVK